MSGFGRYAAKTVRFHVLNVESGKGWAVALLFDSKADRYVVASDYYGGRQTIESGTRTRADLDFERVLGRLAPA